MLRIGSARHARRHQRGRCAFSRPARRAGVPGPGGFRPRAAAGTKVTHRLQGVKPALLGRQKQTTADAVASNASGGRRGTEALAGRAFQGLWGGGPGALPACSRQAPLSSRPRPPSPPPRPHGLPSACALSSPEARALSAGSGVGTWTPILGATVPPATGVKSRYALICYQHCHGCIFKNGTLLF